MFGFHNPVTRMIHVIFSDWLMICFLRVRSKQLYTVRIYVIVIILRLRVSFFLEDFRHPRKLTLITFRNVLDTQCMFKRNICSKTYNTYI